MLIDHNASLIIEAPIAVGGSGHWFEILAGEEKEELYVVVALSVNCTAAAVQGLVAATVHDVARSEGSVCPLSYLGAVPSPFCIIVQK